MVGHTVSYLGRYTARNNGANTGNYPRMDPTSTISNILQLTIKIRQALRNMKDLEADAAALSQLVRSVQNVIQDTAAEFDNSRLSKPAAVQALKARRVARTSLRCACLKSFFIAFIKRYVRADRMSRIHLPTASS